MAKLAMQGGKKVRSKVFPGYRTIGEEERKAVEDVMRSGVLSKFFGSWDKDFYGGPQVQALESEWAAFVGAKHAIAVNSATSGLYCALGALGVGPGDEVIVPPYTMAASVTAPLIFNAIPVFADIEEKFYCIDPVSVETRITPRTKAIVAVDLFGQPFDAQAIRYLAERHGLKVVEDAAQAPGAMYHGRMAGMSGDLGVYSLNYHKHIHCGEGGVVVTDDDALAERVRMIRNHAEAVAGGRDLSNLINMVGFNFRMTELEAAIAREQLKKLSPLLRMRQENVAYLSGLLEGIPCLKPAKTREGSTHAYYVHPIDFDPEVAGVSRRLFVDAVMAELPPTEFREEEGVLMGCGYVKPLYLLPMYQKRIAYGSQGCPFSCPLYHGQLDYAQGLCPVCEKKHFTELITHELMRPPMDHRDLDDVATAFEKVWDHRRELHE